MTPHTPGPWSVEERACVNGKPEFAVVAGDRVVVSLHNHTVDRRADARLIAAAPEMWDILAGLYKEHADAHPQSSVCRCPHWKNYRALLARIEGKKP